MRLAAPLLALTLLAVPATVIAADDLRFDPAAVKAHVTFLADDTLDGRGSGSKGYQIAAIDFSVQGGFHDILALIYKMEAQDHIGTIAKADIELKTIRVDNDRQPMLVATLRLNRLVQNPKTQSQNEAS